MKLEPGLSLSTTTRNKTILKEVNQIQDLLMI